ncbi:MAG: ABC transporter ATP-binding protein [Planctomycetota bacterium]
MLRVRGLGVRYGAEFWALRSANLEIGPGESVGVVGESGSGKSTLARAVVGLAPIAQGVIEPGLVERRGTLQAVFQDPGGSLDPRKRVWWSVAEPLMIAGGSSRRELRARAGSLLDACGLGAEFAGRYPHQLSGGQRQRVAIARALSTEPDLLVLDEPTSALDVSVQAQVLNLLADLRRDRSLAYLFITHDMAVVAHMCERVVVMREGQIVEEGPSNRVLAEPSEAYTAELIAAVPMLPRSA